MPKHSKRYNELARSVDTKQVYEPAQALEMVKKTASATSWHAAISRADNNAPGPDW